MPRTIRLCIGVVSNNSFDFRQAWKQLGDMEAEQAMQEYISCVNVLDPEGSTKVNGTICQPRSQIALNSAAFSFNRNLPLCYTITLGNSPLLGSAVLSQQGSVSLCLSFRLCSLSFASCDVKTLYFVLSY